MSSFAEEIVQFINQFVDSIDQLEILRILALDRQKKWTSAALAEEVQTTPAMLEVCLETLDRRGLLRVFRQPTLACQYGVRTPKMEQEVIRLLRLYNERPVTLIRMLDARSIGSL